MANLKKKENSPEQGRLANAVKVALEAARQHEEGGDPRSAANRVSLEQLRAMGAVDKHGPSQPS